MDCIICYSATCVGRSVSRSPAPEGRPDSGDALRGACIARSEPGLVQGRTGAGGHGPRDDRRQPGPDHLVGSKRRRSVFLRV